MVRLLFIQVIYSSEYKEKCRKQAENRIEIKPIRGTIFDRDSRPLTINIQQYSFAAHPHLIKDKSSLSTILASTFGKSPEAYLKLLQSNKTFVWLERNVYEDQARPLLQNSFPGIVVFKSSYRHYPFGEIGGQLLGFTDVDNRGISGLELKFDPYLSGESGWKIIQKDGWGRQNNRLDLPMKKPIDGDNITLTINQEYQTILQEELNIAFQHHSADKAMGILIDPISGEILAMASVPFFNPNHQNQYPISNQKNSVITDIFEPGSTFKIVTATASLEENVILPSDSIYCEEGVIKIGKISIHDHKKYKTLSFSEVIKKSSNIGTIKVAQKIGNNLLFKYIRKYGFGAKTCIAFPGEENGIVRPIKEWNNLMLAQASIGHGVCCTTLQLAYAYAAIANGGFLLKPQIIQSIQTAKGITIYRRKPEIIRSVASSETMEKMRKLLRLTVQSGTGSQAEVFGMEIAGKTGTAQKVTENGYSQTDYVATFVGFFPVDNPKMLCVIVIDNPKNEGHTGGRVSAPVVREVFKRIVNLSDELFFNEDKVPIPTIRIAADKTSRNTGFQTMTAIFAPRNKSLSEKTLFSTIQQVSKMPDVTGKTLRQALSILQSIGLKVQVEGTGIIISQVPLKGKTIYPGTECHLKLEPRRFTVD